MPDFLASGPRVHHLSRARRKLAIRGWFCDLFRHRFSRRRQRFAHRSAVRGDRHKRTRIRVHGMFGLVGQGSTPIRGKGTYNFRFSCFYNERFASRPSCPAE